MRCINIANYASWNFKDESLTKEIRIEYLTCELLGLNDINYYDLEKVKLKNSNHYKLYDHHLKSLATDLSLLIKIFDLNKVDMRVILSNNHFYSISGASTDKSQLAYFSNVLNANTNNSNDNQNYTASSSSTSTISMQN